MPLFGNKENRTWDENPLGNGLRALLYFFGLVWAFLGVSIIADIFMSAIETITSAEKKLAGTDICVKVLYSVGVHTNTATSASFMYVRVPVVETCTAHQARRPSSLAFR